MPKKLTNEQFIQKSKDIWGDSYTYEKCEYAGANKPVTLYCKKHCIDFQTVPLSHMYQLKNRKPSGCPECGKESYTSIMIKPQEQFIAECIEKHGNKYDYSKVVYTGKECKITIICPVHGEFSQKANVHLNGHGCQQCAAELVSEQSTMSHEEFIARVKIVHPTLDFSDTVYTKSSNRITYVCQKHGKKSAVASSVMSGRGCKQCGKERGAELAKNDTEYFISQGRKSYGDLYSYESSVYTGNKKPITVTCKTHGDFPTNAGNHMAGNGGGCPKCSGINSTVEQTLIDAVGFPCELRNRKILGGLEIDVLYGSLGVEVNGVYWHSTSQGKDRDYHLNKTLLAMGKGGKLVHFWDYEIIDKLEIVVSMVKSRLGNSTKVGARNTSIIELDNSTFNAFVNTSHISGDSVCSKRYGLMYDGVLISAMGFSKSRFDKSCEWEIVRFCNLNGYTVVGGASKLFKFFLDSVQPESVVSYADRRFGEGEVYRKLGFEFSHSSKPNYFHIKGHKRYSRYMTQKHNLPTLLGDKFDSSLSEIENLKNCGFHQVFDCGNNVYKWFANKNHPKVV